MADANLLDISRKLYESEHKTKASAAPDFIKAVSDVITPIVAQSKVKTEAFLATIPADFNMAKVPPELRDKLKAYATNAKNEYSQAAKDAGRFDSGDQRYQDAVDKMNKIRFGFENLLGDVTHLMQTNSTKRSTKMISNLFTVGAPGHDTMKNNLINAKLLQTDIDIACERLIPHAAAPN